MILTLGIPVQDDKVLLGMKKRGFGAGRWNGFGGKAKEGESLSGCLIRECWEEAGISVNGFSKQAVFRFVFPEESFEVHLFRIESFEGVPAESEEMEPRWFSHEQIPFQDMWPDDQYWFPRFLEGKKFLATFAFKDQNTVIDYSLMEIDELPNEPE